MSTPNGSPVLAVRDLTVGYKNAGLGINNISLEVSKHDAVTLVGPNGAGKTSTLRGICGFLPREPGYVVAGQVEFLGESVAGLSSLKLSRRGLAFVPEERKIFGELTVAENLQIGRLARRGNFAEQYDTALSVFAELTPHLNSRAAVLSGGQRQMLGLASALCMNPRLLVIDEATLGLAPQLIRSLGDALSRIVDLGLPILMAEQNRSLAMTISSKVYVLAAGNVLGSGSPAEVRDHPDLAAAFVGA